MTYVDAQLLELSYILSKLTTFSFVDSSVVVELSNFILVSLNHLLSFCNPSTHFINLGEAISLPGLCRSLVVFYYVLELLGVLQLVIDLILGLSGIPKESSHIDKLFRVLFAQRNDWVHEYLNHLAQLGLYLESMDLSQVRVGSIRLESSILLWRWAAKWNLFHCVLEEAKRILFLGGSLLRWWIQLLHISAIERLI